MREWVSKKLNYYKSRNNNEDYCSYEELQEHSNNFNAVLGSFNDYLLKKNQIIELNKYHINTGVKSKYIK